MIHVVLMPKECWLAIESILHLPAPIFEVNLAGTHDACLSLPQAERWFGDERWLAAMLVGIDVA